MKSKAILQKFIPSFILLLLSNVAYQQALKKISRNLVAPSPEAASFTKYGITPVGNYTGIPNINIPLYNIEDRDLTMPISLSYHASGIQVAEEAGWTGLGWNLNVGGVITREIHGTNDLRMVIGDPVIPSTPFTYKGYPFDPAIPNTTPIPGDYVSKICKKEIDPEPDIFYYNFLGESGSFILPKQDEYTSEIVGKPVNPDEIKIIFDKATKKWIITTKNGTTLYFSVAQRQETRRYEQPSLFGVQACQNYFSEATMLNNVGYYYNNEDVNATAWYLEKIVSATGETISFSYDLFSPSTLPPGTLVSKYGSTTLIFNDIASKDFNIQTQGTGTNCFPQCPESKIRDFNRIFTEHIYLKEIHFRNGSIEFKKSDRSDLRAANTIDVFPITPLLRAIGSQTVSKGPQKLDSLIIKDINGNIVKRFAFEYSYFNNDATTNIYTLKRLKLLRVKEISNNDTSSLSPYEFTYDEQHPLPVKYSRAIDFWGYYNGVQTNASRVPIGSYTPPGGTPIVVGDANRNPNGTYMTSGIIKQIKYPTGGTTTFKFEPNDYYSYGTGVFDLTESLPTGIPLNSNGIYAKQAGGLRIKEIINSNSLGDTISKKIYKYVSDDATKSSGKLMIFPSFHSLEGVATTLLYFYNGCSYSASTLSGKSSSYLPYANSAQGSIVGYDKVTVMEISNGISNGYNDYYYDNQVESIGSQNSAFFGTIPNIRHTSNGNLLKKKVFNASGQIVSQEVNLYSKQLLTQIPGVAFRQNIEGIVARIGPSEVDISCDSYQANEKFNILSDRNVLSQSTVTNYSINGTDAINTITKYEYDTVSHLQLKKTTTINSTKDTISDNYTYTNNASWIPYDIYNVKHIYIPVEITKIDNQKPISSVRESYEISPLTQIAVVTKSESSIGSNPLETNSEVLSFDGIGNPITVKSRDQNFTTYRWGYNYQYPIASVSNTVDTSFNKISSTGANVFIGPTGPLQPNPALTTFNQDRAGGMTISPGYSVPVGANVTITYRLTGPSNKTGYFTYNPSTGLCNESHIVIPNMPAGTYTLSVTGSGSYSSFTFGIGVSVSFQGTENETQFFYENFEENTDTEVATGNAHTGKKYWNGSTVYHPPFYNSDREYIIQWWTLTAGKWVFHEEPFSSSTQLSGVVDDVRIFPIDGEMTSYTYAPLIGMTSKTDPNGYTIIYEYDNFGRLKLVKDDKGVILRKVKYNYLGSSTP